MSPTSRFGEAMKELLAAIDAIPPKANEFRLVNAYDAVLAALSENRARIPNSDHLTVQELQAMQGLVNMLLQHKVCGNPVGGVTMTASHLCLSGHAHGDQYRYVLDGAHVCVKCLALAAWCAPSAERSTNALADKLEGFLQQGPDLDVREWKQVLKALRAPSSSDLPHEPPMVYDPKVGKMVKPGGDKLAWIEEEMKDGDRICEAADVRRTEGGRLPVAKIINKLNAANSATSPLNEAIDLLDDARHELRCASGAIHRAPITETRIKEVTAKISAFLIKHHPTEGRDANG